MIKLFTILCIAVPAAVLLGCSNPSGNSSGPRGDFDIYLPDESSVWMLWETETVIQYDVDAVEDSYQVKVEIVKADSLAADLGNWVINTGTLTIPDQIPGTFGPGDDYRIRIVTAKADTAYSAEFTIEGYDLGGFAEIPAGSFQMGSEEGEWYHQQNESPLHTVTIQEPFEMMTTEVRQIIWENVMGENPSYFSGDSFPVESVTWDDCQLFIQTLNEIDPDYNYRLPSEAEWEYACRAGTDTWFYWGDDNSSGTVSQFGWYNPNSEGEVHKVGGLEPNAWGLYDMCGNVYEFCQDVYHDSYDGAPTDGSAWEAGGDPGYRVQRGGSWSNNVQFLRCATRSKLGETQTSISTGLRLIREPE